MTTRLITGAPSGLGRALAERALAAGHQVVATARNTDALDDLRAAYPGTAKSALPGVRGRGNGLLINISSVGAYHHSGRGFYSAAKAALEGLSGPLRKEIEPSGLRVLVVEPGSFRTDFRGRSADRSSVQIEAYDQVLERTGDSALSPQRGAPEKAAAAILQAAEDAESPKLLVLGSDALGGLRQAADDPARDVDRFEQLSRSTDAAS
ncbi:SDR family NAD(P)-dependent oxidoreductase [Rhodococcus koreensis]|uniref:SDR family NAD(P)-dependent oxidoreductase n=1 Tax=Rhodococcus koreensis TaxID=99653 RepID=UPI0036731B56